MLLVGLPLLSKTCQFMHHLISETREAGAHGSEGIQLSRGCSRPERIRAAAAPVQLAAAGRSQHKFSKALKLILLPPFNRKLCDL